MHQASQSCHDYKHTRTQTNIHTHRHTRRHTHAHTRTHTHTHARTRIHKHTHAHAYAHALLHTHTHTHTNMMKLENTSRKPTSEAPHTHMHVHTHTHPSPIHTHTPTHTNKHALTHIHIHTYQSNRAEEFIGQAIIRGARAGVAPRSSFGGRLVLPLRAVPVLLRRVMIIKNTCLYVMDGIHEFCWNSLDEYMHESKCSCRGVGAQHFHQCVEVCCGVLHLVAVCCCAA